MQEMEPDFKVSHVVDDMVNEPLGEALYNPDSQVPFQILTKIAFSYWWSCSRPP